MGRMQRDKGKKFERAVATAFREGVAWLLNAAVRRSIQSRGAERSDVQVPGLWVECQDARKTTPLLKLQQAEGDKSAAEGAEKLIPIAVIHALGERKSFVWLRLGNLMTLAGLYRPTCVPLNEGIVITIELDQFIELYRNSAWAKAQAKEEELEAEL